MPATGWKTATCAAALATCSAPSAISGRDAAQDAIDLLHREKHHAAHRQRHSDQQEDDPAAAAVLIPAVGPICLPVGSSGSR